MRFSEYITYDAVDLARLVSKGEVTSSELSAIACAAIEAFNGQINAVLETFPETEPARGGSVPGRPLPRRFWSQAWN